MINTLHMLISISECNTVDTSHSEGESVGDHNQDESDTRQVMKTKMDQTIEAADLLSNYSGYIKDEQEWNYTTSNKPLKLYAVHTEDMTILDARIHCTKYGQEPGIAKTTRIWNGDTTRASDMPALTSNEKYWIQAKQRTAESITRTCATLEIWASKSQKISR